MDNKKTNETVGFSKETQDIVLKKLNDAASVVASLSVNICRNFTSSEQFLMFVYEKMQQEEFYQKNLNVIGPLLEKKQATIHLLKKEDGEKNDK